MKNNVCECGREFDHPQSLNAHYRWCIIHRNGKPPVHNNLGKTLSTRGKKYEEIFSAEVAAKKRRDISEASKNAAPKLWSDEAKRKHSLRTIKRNEANESHVKWFEVNGVKVQGTWERDVAIKFVENQIKFERKVLPYSRTRHYTPDFYLPEFDLFIEVKGWLSDNNKRKYGQVIKEYDGSKFRMMFGSEKDKFLIDEISIHDLPSFLEVDFQI